MPTTESEIDEGIEDSTLPKLLLLVKKDEQDQEQHSELDTISVDTLDELGPADREVEACDILSLPEDPTPCTDDGIILYFATGSGLKG